MWRIIIVFSAVIRTLWQNAPVGNNSENSDIVFVALNQNILRLDISDPCTHKAILGTSKGEQLGFAIAGKWIYDPKFGVPKSYQDMGEEQCIAVEDWFIEFFLVGDMVDRWTIVATLT